MNGELPGWENNSHYRCVQTDTYAGIMAFDLKQEIAALKNRLRRVKTTEARERIEKTIEVMENSRKCIQSLNAKIQGWD